MPAGRRGKRGSQCPTLNAPCTSVRGESARASRVTSSPKSASTTTATSSIAKQLVDAAVDAGADAVKFQKRKLRETYREEIIDQPRHGEQGLQYIVPLLIEFELSDDQFRELFAYCRVAADHGDVHAVGSVERRFPRDLRSGGLQDWLARPHELSADRVRRRDREADAALDRHVDRRGSAPHAGVPRAARRRIRALSLRQHLSRRGGRDQPALHGTAARMVAASGRLLGARHRHRRSPWPPSRWARGCSSGTSRWTRRCGAPITRRASSRRSSPNRCARCARSSCRSACRTAGSRAARPSTGASSARAWWRRPTFPRTRRSPARC